ncbi:HAD family hydrolase [Paenibacillus yanchengensis]|uniref:Phosphoserine phosphatase n=1 Tax=Paenibacillus yanchengensis TaxID=2035833 RepID=A0ABW4YPZ1_9BACL
MTKKAVLFDLDDTLLWDERSIKEAFEATCMEAARVVDVDPEKLEEAVRMEARALYETYDFYPFTKMIGINPFEGLWGDFKAGDLVDFRKMQEIVPTYRKDAWTNGLKKLGVDHAELGAKLAELFPAERRQRPIIYEETYAVLEQLKGKYKLLLLTNGSPDLQQEKLSGVPTLASYFDHIVISGQFGEGKPKASIFQYAMEQLQITADEGVMVGDKLTTDILGANGVGMDSVWLNRHHATRNDEIIPTYEIENLNELLRILAEQS